MGSSQVLWIGDSHGLPGGWERQPLPDGRSSPALIGFCAPPEAPAALASRKFAAIVLDVPASSQIACDLLQQALRSAPAVPVLVRDPNASISDAVRLTRLGVRQFLTSAEETFGLLDAAVEDFRRDLARLAAKVEDGWERLLVGESNEMRMIQEVIRVVASRRATVLITGETGTGKELAARSLHLAGCRRTGPWVAVNCGALPESLMESELFGHVRGAFTGAIQSRAGRFEQAQGGTLFLDEIGELPVELQAKLLRALQEREVQRLGSSETVHVDVRVVTATNCDLAERVRQGRFREDLYYRLNVVPLEMPPLRCRPRDVPLLARHFVEKICRAEGIPGKQLTGEALALLCSHPWPGNVRQLENAVEMAIALSGDRQVLGKADFPLPAAGWLRPEGSHAPVIAVPDGGLDYEETLAVIERSILEQALRKTGGNKKAAAEMLGLKRTTLSAKVRSLEAVA
jgi:DNA-binding NtrC family response regulator